MRAAPAAAGAAGARLPAARGAPEGARRVPERAQGRALRDLAPHRRDAKRRLDRHRGRHRHAVRVRRRWAATSCRRATSLHEGPAVVARQEGQLRGDAHPGAARRRRRPHQRLQLPDLGLAREIRAELPRGHALHRQARDVHQLPHRGAGPHDHRVGLLPEGACNWSSARPATCSTGSTASDIVTFTGSADTAAKLRARREPDRAARSVQRRGRFAQRRDPRPRHHPDDEEFDLFAKEVAREMTVKAGQKCAAIRRGSSGRHPRALAAGCATAWRRSASAIRRAKG